jgi:hypothetical protein
MYSKHAYLLYGLINVSIKKTQEAEVKSGSVKIGKIEEESKNQNKPPKWWFPHLHRISEMPGAPCRIELQTEDCKPCCLHA